MMGYINLTLEVKGLRSNFGPRWANLSLPAECTPAGGRALKGVRQLRRGLTWQGERPVLRDPEEGCYINLSLGEGAYLLSPEGLTIQLLSFSLLLC